MIGGASGCALREAETGKKRVTKKYGGCIRRARIEGRAEKSKVGAASNPVSLKSGGRPGQEKSKISSDRGGDAARGTRHAVAQDQKRN